MENSSKIPTERIDVLDNKLENIDNTLVSLQQSILDLNTRLEEVNTNLTTLINNNYTDLNTKITDLQTRATNLEARRYITTHWKSGTSWYSIWSDGWIEQGFRITTTVDAQTNHTFLKPFKDTNYTLLITIYSTTTKFNGSQPDWITAYTNTGFSYHCDSYAGQPWVYACGY